MTPKAPLDLAAVRTYAKDTLSVAGSRWGHTREARLARHALDLLDTLEAERARHEELRAAAEYLWRVSGESEIDACVTTGRDRLAAALDALNGEGGGP